MEIPQHTPTKVAPTLVSGEISGELNPFEKEP